MGTASASFPGPVEAPSWSLVACRGSCAAAAALPWNVVVVVVLLLLMLPIQVKADAASRADPKMGRIGLRRTDGPRGLGLERVVGPEQKAGSSTWGPCNLCSYRC